MGIPQCEDDAKAHNGRKANKQRLLSQPGPLVRKRPAL